MPPTLLWGETFDGESGTVNLSTRSPVPGPGAAAEYVGGATRYKVFATGYAAGQSNTVSVARWPDLIAAGLSVRIVVDVFREGVDQVGGEMDFYAYTPDTAIASWDFKDCLRYAIQRHSFNAISASSTWVKEASEPAPPTLLLTLAGDLAHAANVGVRYGFQFDEVLGKVSIWRADAASFGAVGFGTGWVQLSEGTLPPELIAHLTADRHIGWAGHHATIGLMGFRLYEVSVWDMGAAAVIAGPPCKCLLTVYDDDGVTVLWEAGTDPVHPNPYLDEPENYGEQRIDVAQGGATLTSISVTVNDPAQIPGDQDSGWLTDRLALFGLANIGGHRCRLIRFVPDGALGYQVLADGPASQPRLNADYASYSWEIRDTRETERTIRCFDVLGTGAPVIAGATPASPVEPGTDYDFDWDVVVSP